MNPEEARLILQCRRPQGQDDALPAMAEAWQVLEDHPDEMAALRADAELDALIGAKLRSFDPPANLRQNILTGARVTPVLPWWRRRSTLLSAAALVMVGLFWSLRPSPDTSGADQPGIVAGRPGLPAATLEEFRQDTTAKVDGHRIRLNKVSAKVDELQTWLATHAKKRQIPVPAGLAPLPTHGCEVFEWKGREVTLMCFETADGGLAHLFTVDASELPADITQPLVASANGWQTLTWKQDGRIMLLTAQTSPEALRRLALPG